MNENMNKEASQELIDAAEFTAALLAKIPAFGDGIGLKISKAQLGIAHNRLMLALTRLSRNDLTAVLPLKIGGVK